ncbi:MAG: thiamine-monophosphate kinase [Spirochaetes bacterium]|nr:thiamine-monophosphate kinase [Spirochaetota bacterium]
MNFKFKNENDLINLISDTLKRPLNQINKVNESDAEIIDRGVEKLLFNIDTFSSEDFFDENDPYTLGWNMAVGCISDILAGGVQPQYYAHSMTIIESWDKKYINKLIMGVRDVLSKFKTSFIGGDVGFGKEWSYTASALSFAQDKLLTRKGAKLNDSIYITGKVGLGNFNAGLNLFSVKNKFLKFNKKFPIRKNETEIIREFASCCIDTSDGVFNSLKIISELGNLGFEVKNIPYHKICLILSGILNIDKLLFFIGECGEYELLFTIPSDEESLFIKKIIGEKLKFYKIGKITENKKRFVIDNERIYDLTELDICARTFKNKKDYISYIINYLNRFKK